MNSETSNFKQQDEERSSWLAAKQIFEKMLHLSHEEMLSHLDALKLSDAAVIDKLKIMIVAMDKNKTLFNLTQPSVIFKKMTHLMDLTGNSIDAYQLEALIALGGMSSVYRAIRQDVDIQKPVAIKVMQPHKSDPSMVTLFEQEQQALSQLDHPNIVSFLYGDKTPTGVYYLVMEFIPGALTLDAYIVQNNCDTRAKVTLIKQVATAIAHAHSHLIIHKDLKATNVLVDQHGTVKVIDFGIAALDDQPSPTQHKIYTPNIASPEQIKGIKITAATDIFSLCATLLGLLIEVAPLPEFEPDDYHESHDKAYINKVLQTAKINRDLKTIIAKGLQTQVKDRYATMDALAQDLNAWLENRPISLLQHKMSYRIKKSFKRNPLSAVALGSMLTALVLGGILVSYYALEARQQAENSATSLNFLKDVLSQSNPSLGNPSDMTIRKALQNTLDQQKTLLSSQIGTKLSIMAHLTEIYSAQSMFYEAAELSGEIYTLLKATEGADALETLQWQKTHAEQLRSSGQHKQSIEISNQLIKQLDDSKTTHANIKLSALLNIADVHLSTKSFALRQNKVQEVMKLINQGIADDDSLISRAWLNMAVLSEQLGDGDALQQDYQQALKHRAMASGKQHPDYASILNSFAVSLTKMGRYEQATPMFIESIELARAYDDKGLVYGRNLLQYTTMLFRAEQRDEAILMLAQSLSVITASGHLFTQLIAHETSYRFNKQMLDFSGALQAAIMSTEKAQELFKADDYPYFKNTMNLAETLVLLNQFELAQKTLQLLLKKPVKLDLKLINNVKFRLGLIAWLMNDHQLIKQHQILNQPGDINSPAFLRQLLEHYGAQKKHVNQINIFTNERTLLMELLGSINSNTPDKNCQLPEQIKSKTDLVLLKVILTLCPNLSNAPQHDLLQATRSASRLEIPASQMQEILKILNHQ